MVDPGRPWESSAPPVVVDGGPAPLLNPQTPPVLLETGDTIAPTLQASLKVTSKRRTASARVAVSEAGTVYARVLRGTRDRVDSPPVRQAGRVDRHGQAPEAQGALPPDVFARDFSGLKSKTTTKSLPR